MDEPDTQAVLFAHGLPDKREDAFKYQMTSASQKRAFMSACDLSEEEAQAIEQRVMLVPSDKLFRKEPTLAKNEKYPAPNENRTATKGVSL